MGRPTKLTPEVQKTICDLIANGNTRECAAGCAGVGASTLWQWMRDNAEFAEAIEKADAQAEARMVLVIEKAAVAGTWQAAARWLEARRAREWQRHERHEITGAEGNALKFVVELDSVDAEDGDD